MRQLAEVRHAGPDDLRRVELLWRELYAHQAAHGLLVTLPSDGFSAWERSLAPLLGKFAAVMLAEREGEAVGFVAGRLRVMPAYLGGTTVAFISEVYVVDHARGTGIGQQMMSSATEWFVAKGATRIELQVLAGNVAAKRFYVELGWREELVQMVWLPSRADVVRP